MNKFLLNILSVGKVPQFFLVFVISSCALTNQAICADNNSNEKPPAEAYTELVKKADSGDPFAQLMLGDMYYEGSSFFQDVNIISDSNKAFYWYNESAKNGNSRAQYNVGCMYLEGIGVVKNVEKALDWLTMSANQNAVIAQRKLGFMFYDGLQSDKDYNKAYYYLEKAAMSGDAKSQNALGYMLLNGQGVNKDVGEARRLFIAASDQGMALARMNLARIFFEGIGVRKDVVEAYKWISLATMSGGAKYMKMKRQIASHMTEKEIKLADQLVEQWKSVHKDS